MKVKVQSPNVQYSNDHILSTYEYQTTKVTQDSSECFLVTPNATQYQFKTNTNLPKFGLMLVGWGGNNGSTVTGGIIANKLGLKWQTKNGIQESNYFGSLMLASTVSLGTDARTGEEIFVPFNDLLPMVHPNEFVIGGWDINKANLAESMQRACVFEPDLQRQLYPHMENLKPLPSIYYSDFIAANQNDRADNLIPGNKQDHLNKIRQDIREFKENNTLDSLVVIWTANTERYSTIIEGVNDSADDLLRSIKENHDEIAPSTIFAVACILEQVPFINGSPQNTFVPGVIELAERKRSFIGGDDFKSGQTKVKSVLVDFLVGAGIKPLAITSYNHLGNNDGKNLSAPQQFRSKEISKSNVVDDMVASNRILYKENEKPDHIVVIKYVPTVGDSKRALDEYVSSIFMGGLNTISIYNVCEDSLLAAPLIIDLAILAELMTRVEYKTNEMTYFASFHSVLSILSFLLKAPIVPNGTPVVNSLAKQRKAIENILR